MKSEICQAVDVQLRQLFGHFWANAFQIRELLKACHDGLAFFPASGGIV
jgi:hypothetical protein